MKTDCNVGNKSTASGTKMLWRPWRQFQHNKTVLSRDINNKAMSYWWSETIPWSLRWRKSTSHST
jgi:hypothetical protein